MKTQLFKWGFQATRKSLLSRNTYARLFMNLQTGSRMFAPGTCTRQDAKHKSTRWLRWGMLTVAAALALGMGRSLVSSQDPIFRGLTDAQTKTQPPRTVVLTGKLNDEQKIALTSALVANRNAGVSLVVS